MENKVLNLVQKVVHEITVTVNELLYQTSSINVRELQVRDLIC